MRNHPYMTTSLDKWLECTRTEQNACKYWEAFQAKGYDRETDITGLDRDDIANLNINDEDEEKLIQAASMFEISPEFHVQCWLEENGLSHYYENFRLSDLKDMKEISHLELKDSIFEELEMDVPGHRKRLERAISKLRKRRRLDEPEDPIAKGFWGKPQHVQSEAGNDFLCLQATLCSTADTSRTMTIDFMVDSGSEVVTVKTEVLEDLRLECLGSIQSHGIHTTKEKPIYKANIHIGAIKIETEVIPETFNSIGINIMKHFRHYIDSHQHVWLKSSQEIASSSLLHQQVASPESQPHDVPSSSSEIEQD